MVAVVRWHGFQIDIPGIKVLLAKAQAIIDNSPVNVNKHGEVRAYITAAMDEMEGVILEESTKKSNIEAIKGWEVTEDEPCTKCGMFDGPDKNCARCHGTGIMRAGKHPAAIRAGEVLDVKIAAKEVELYKKLLLAGKFHASFVVIGTLSSRMAGADGLNPQGIKHTTEVRKMFPLVWPGYILSLGDFASFEVTLADAVYNDPNLRECLCSGKKIHALFGMEMFPGKSYQDILDSADTEFDMYTKGKQGVFGMIYGGDWNTLVGKFGIAPEVAQRAENGFFKKFPGIPKAREKTFNAFCSMKQPGGLGSAVVWADPADYIESFLGFRRYFTLENKIEKALFDLARKLPKNWQNVKVKVVRRDRVQTAGGAVSSALYGATFGMQAANMRAAANHEIQSPGAQITKYVQRKLWDLQPAGVGVLQISIMNVHDEILCVHLPALTETILSVVREGVEYFRPKVPLIGMDWCRGALNWAEKHGASDVVKIRAPEMSK
jgi:DNA polymerase I-like protein with 3'-5' exonuclease and polymerase domains